MLSRERLQTATDWGLDATVSLKLTIPGPHISGRHGIAYNSFDGYRWNLRDGHAFAGGDAGFSGSANQEFRCRSRHGLVKLNGL